MKTHYLSFCVVSILTSALLAMWHPLTAVGANINPASGNYCVDENVGLSVVHTSAPAEPSTPCGCDEWIGSTNIVWGGDVQGTPPVTGSSATLNTSTPGTKLVTVSITYSFSCPVGGVTPTAGTGSVSPAIGPSTRFTANKTPGTATVTAQVGTTTCTITFNVIAPDGGVLTSDLAVCNIGTPWSTLTPGPPNNFIGNGRSFQLFIQPQTVSFYNVSFQENAPIANFTWPDSTVQSLGPVIAPFNVGQDNGNTDCSGSGHDPIGRLSGTPFTWDRAVPLEYKNEAGLWTYFVTDFHSRLYQAAGGCAIKVQGGTSTPVQSAVAGPWAN